jgi:hypothetical protein
LEVVPLFRGKLVLEVCEDDLERFLYCAHLRP